MIFKDPDMHEIRWLKFRNICGNNENFGSIDCLEYNDLINFESPIPK